jgi:hypothetical protein
MVDTTSISVSVNSNGNVQTYTLGSDILSVNSSSKVYYLEADQQQKYKISFGDGILGQQPTTGSIVTISYRVCNGEMTNGSNTFTLVNQTIDGQSSIVIVPVGRASGGANIQDIESIRFNAPKMYETQNRTVTAEDYRRLITDQNPDISSINVWGGEENDPPIYGKVFIAAKPKNGTLFSANRKAEIVQKIKKYNVQSIDVDIIDPTYLYIVPFVNVRYDPTKTTRTPGELASAVSAKIIGYEQSYLGNFGQSFRYSRFLDYIDGTDDAILGTDAQIRLRKTFTPNLSGVNSYALRFNNSLQRLGTKELISGVSRHPGYGSVTSSSFTYANQESYFDDNGFGVLRIYYRSGAARLGRVYTNYTAGSIDYDAGVVDIQNFLPTAYTGDTISVIAAPLNPNINPVRNQILLLSQCVVNIINDNNNQTVATASNVETIGQISTLVTPSLKLYNF